MSLISVEVDPDVPSEVALQRVRDRVDLAKAELPLDAEEPRRIERLGHEDLLTVAETTLHLGGKGSIDRVRGAVMAFFEHWGELYGDRDDVAVDGRFRQWNSP